MEMILRQHLDGSVEVTSAGVRGLPSWPVSEQMATQLSSHGIPQSEIGNFRSRFLDVGFLDDIDLMVTASTGHTSQILEREPLALRKTFTLGELMAVATLMGESADQEPVVSSSLRRIAPDAPQSTDAERLAQVVAAAPRIRNRIPGGIKQFDIPDPYGKSAQHYAQAFALIKNQTNALANALQKL